MTKVQSLNGMGNTKDQQERMGLKSLTTECEADHAGTGLWDGWYLWAINDTWSFVGCGSSAYWTPSVRRVLCQTD